MVFGKEGICTEDEEEDEEAEDELPAALLRGVDVPPPPPPPLLRMGVEEILEEELDSGSSGTATVKAKSELVTTK